MAQVALGQRSPLVAAAYPIATTAGLGYAMRELAQLRVVRCIGAGDLSGSMGAARWDQTTLDTGP